MTINRSAKLDLIAPIPGAWRHLSHLCIGKTTQVESKCRPSCKKAQRCSAKVTASLSNGDIEEQMASSSASPPSKVSSPSSGYQLQLSESLLQQIIELPGSTYGNVKQRAEALAFWKSRLRVGALPKIGQCVWPEAALQKELTKSLTKLDMPSFCRRYPALLDALLKQIVQIANDYEAKMKEDEENKPPPPPPSQNPIQSQSPPQDGENDENQDQQQQDTSGQEGQESSDPQDGQNGQQSIEMELKEGEVGENIREMERDERERQGKAEEAAKELVKEFEQEWEPVMENVKEANETFANLDGLMDGPQGFDKSRSLWKDAGWKEIRDLRKMLENLKELTNLVNSLGRSSGKGPLKRAPQQVYASRGHAGVHRSPLQPEETRSLTRSDDISRMLPSEAHLLAASSRNSKSGVLEKRDPSGQEERQEWTALRRLHMARRAERSLLSYERSGWLEETTKVTPHYEIRPSADMGPIICCLDTSGSMYGARETVAKAVTLEAMRGAYRQKRQCFLYAFGGPGDVMELELNLKDGDIAVEKLLSFLKFSFGGGTDVDRPLQLSLDRLQQDEWKQADILMVSDGEIPAPSDKVLDQLQAAKEDLNLEVHALLVGGSEKEVVKLFASHIHHFRAWDAVKTSY